MSGGDASYLSLAGFLSRGFLWLVTNLGFVASRPAFGRRGELVADVKSWELCRKTVRNQN